MASPRVGGPLDGGFLDWWQQQQQGLPPGPPLPRVPPGNNGLPPGPPLPKVGPPQQNGPPLIPPGRQPSNPQGPQGQPQDNLEQFPTLVPPGGPVGPPGAPGGPGPGLPPPPGGPPGLPPAVGFGGDDPLARRGGPIGAFMSPSVNTAPGIRNLMGARAPAVTQSSAPTTPQGAPMGGSNLADPSNPVYAAFLAQQMAPPPVQPQAVSPLMQMLMGR